MLSSAEGAGCALAERAWPQEAVNDNWYYLVAPFGIAVLVVLVVQRLGLVLVGVFALHNDNEVHHIIHRRQPDLQSKLLFERLRKASSIDSFPAVLLSI